MKKILACFALLAAVGLTSSVASAATACSSDIGDNVLVAGFSCSIGSLTFSNFNSNSNSTQGVTIASATGSLVLSPNLPTNGSPSMGDIDLWFVVSGGITGVGASINGPSGAFVNETVCDSAGLASPASGGICVNPRLAFITAFGGNPQVNATFASSNPVTIFKDINDGGGAVSEVTQVYTSGVPEPMTLSTMGVGLLGLGLISRRRKKS